MNIIADTNLLVRFLVRDDERQFEAVFRLFERAGEIAIPTHVLCELIWVLRHAYGLKPDDMMDDVRRIVRSQKVVVNDNEVEAGFAMLESGGDFADGVNAHAGRAMVPGAVFASFDRKAVKLLARQGVTTTIPE